MSGADLDTARDLAEQVLADPGATAAVRCQALELVGRSHRVQDLAAARTAFGAGLAQAVAETCLFGSWVPCTSSARSISSTTPAPNFSGRHAVRPKSSGP